MRVNTMRLKTLCSEFHKSLYRYSAAIDYADFERMRKDQRYINRKINERSIVELITGDIDYATRMMIDLSSNAIY